MGIECSDRGTQLSKKYDVKMKDESTLSPVYGAFSS